MPHDDWSVYLVRCADESLYTGIAKDVEARVLAHNSGRGASYTRSRRPVRLVYRKNGMTRSAALIEEARIKSLERPEKMSLLKRGARALATLALLWVAATVQAVPVFNAENAIILPGAAAQSFTGAYPNLRMYYIPVLPSTAPHASSGTAIMSALSADGVAWAADAGVRIDQNTLPSVSLSSITGCAVQRKVDLTYRMLYSIVSTTGAYRIQNAVSNDGLTWVNQTAVAIDGVTTYVGVPRIVVLDSGDWRLYYTRDSNGGNDPADRQIYTALSSNEGATWGASSVVLSTLAYESGASKLTDGRVRLFYTQPAIGSASSATVIVSALSTNALGTTFAQETGARLSTPIAAGAVSYPVAVRSTDTYRWRLYYNYQLAGTFTGDLYSALAAAPAPSAVTPSTVFNSGTNALAITGEIFSDLPAIPTVSISQGGVTINGTGVARPDDQQITANFLTQGQPLGSWNLNVTNADGVTTTLVGALTLDFSPGTVLLTNNLLRPRSGVSTTIDITTFNPGRIKVRVHDSTGREIRTLFDDDRGSGTFTLTWDGKTAAGASAASGVYLVVVSGPKIATKSKVVLIR
jgi:predicted GIY-YIG superfamily endonuclease